MIIKNALSKNKIDKDCRGYEKLLVAIALQAVQDYLNGPSKDNRRNYTKIKQYQRDKINSQNKIYASAKRYIFDGISDNSIFGFSSIMNYFQIDIPHARKKIRLSNSKQTALRSLPLDRK